MFDGKAEEAINLYVGLFGGVVLDVSRYAPGEAGAEGTVLHASLRIRARP
jgi:predicted 3-demethylubiquinone-9 3-methyltransferase (glyoxalase superfamily)